MRENRPYGSVGGWGLIAPRLPNREQTLGSTLGWVSVQSRACLSNHISDLTKALWLISEKSMTLFLHFNNQQSSLDNHQSAFRDASGLPAHGQRNQGTWDRLPACPA